MKPTASRPRLIVTRPAGDSAHWVEQLRQGGWPAEAFALIDIAGLSAPAQLQSLAQAWQALPGYAACLFVSGHAVSHFFKPNWPLVHTVPVRAAINKIADSVVSGGLAGCRFMAPGPGTVAALLAAGVPATQIDAPPPDAGQFDSEALWQVIGQRDWQAQRVLVVRGLSSSAEGSSSGRDWIAAQWRAAGASVDFVAVYERRAPVLTQAQLQRAQAASDDGSVWIFSSSEAFGHLLGLPELHGIDWRRARAIATHPRIAQAVRAAGWGRVTESRPALGDIVQAARSIESQHP